MDTQMSGGIFGGHTWVCNLVTAGTEARQPETFGNQGLRLGDVLTTPLEKGSEGASCWMLSRKLRDKMG